MRQHKSGSQREGAKGENNKRGKPTLSDRDEENKVDRPVKNGGGDSDDNTTPKRAARSVESAQNKVKTQITLLGRNY